MSLKEWMKKTVRIELSSGDWVEIIPLSRIPFAKLKELGLLDSEFISKPVERAFSPGEAYVIKAWSLVDENDRPLPVPGVDPTAADMIPVGLIVEIKTKIAESINDMTIPKAESQS